MEDVTRKGECSWALNGLLTVCLSKNFMMPPELGVKRYLTIEVTKSFPSAIAISMEYVDRLIAM